MREDLAQVDEVRFDTGSIVYTVVRTARWKKTIEIRLDATAGVVVAAPRAASREQIREIVRNRAAWIIERLSEGVVKPPVRALTSGELLPYLGGNVCLEVVECQEPRVRVRLSKAVLRVAVPSELSDDARENAVRVALKGWYTRQAKQRVPAAVSRWSAVSGYVPARVLIRDQRRRWGSCAADGTLRFNWRTVMAEPALLDYVVVHELVHIRHKNHAREFWDAVEAVMPDYAQRRAKLKEIGPRLTL